VAVKSITLMMLGGVSLIQGDLPPGREAWMAFAGPLASFVIAALSYGAFRLFPLPAEVAAAVLAFALTNALLGAFNLLPAFPMDGGRVVRGLLARRMGVEKATAVAARLGKVMAALFALFALWTLNLILLLIAWFVYAGARAEQERLSVLHALEGLPVEDLMSSRLGEASAEEPVREVLRRLVRGDMAGARVWGHNGAPDPHLLGVVTTEGLEGAAEHGGAGAPVTAVLDPRLPAAHPWDEAAGALQALSSGEARAVVVLDAADTVVGLVTPNELRRAVVLGRLARR
jgi:hypothetical protein